MTITSPCTGVCKLDDTTAWCLGCGRSDDEIADWRMRSDASRDAVWAEIPDRLSQLGVECRRLAWSTEDIRDFAVTTLKEGRGTWVMGVVGAVAEMTAATGEDVDVELEGDDVTARTRNGAIRMTINDDVRALTFDPPAIGAPRIMLAVKRERGRLPDKDVVTDLGEDTGALLGGDGSRQFDFGLGRKEARFTVRVGDTPVREALQSSCGVTFADAMPKVGGAVLADSPTRVIETALGRVEVQGQIPPPGGVSPDGPHTHLLPDHLATGRATPVGMDLPRAYLPGAIFYPPRQS
ncbi:MAG: DUF1289 domain-containing protein [Pseudomonadota bacterium]